MGGGSPHTPYISFADVVRVKTLTHGGSIGFLHSGRYASDVQKVDRGVRAFGLPLLLQPVEGVCFLLCFFGNNIDCVECVPSTAVHLSAPLNGLRIAAFRGTR